MPSVVFAPSEVQYPEMERPSTRHGSRNGSSSGSGGGGGLYVYDQLCGFQSNFCGS